MASPIKGMDQLLRNLNTLKDRSSKKIAKAGVNAGLMVMKKRLTQAVNGSKASTQMKAAARKTIAKRIKRKEGKTNVGKAGFGVGKKSKRKKESAHQRNIRGQGGRREVRGTGISASNIHWPVLGTSNRQSSERPTGRMPAVLGGIMEAAASTAGPAMLSAAKKKMSQVMASEAAKLKNK